MTKLVIVTGAGISAPSGIPTYRNNSVGWNNERLEYISQSIRYGNFLDELWVHWSELYDQMAGSSPNEAHRWVTALTKLNHNTKVLTQNIDGLHKRAGAKAVELHGNILTTRCLRCKSVRMTTYAVLWRDGTHMCIDCDSPRVRPNIVLFGERYSREAREAVEAAQNADVLVMVGTSGNVFPVADLPAQVHKNGGKTVLVNAESWGNFDHYFIGDARKELGYFACEFMEGKI